MTTMTSTERSSLRHLAMVATPDAPPIEEPAAPPVPAQPPDREHSPGTPFPAPDGDPARCPNPDKDKRYPACGDPADRLAMQLATEEMPKVR